MYMIDTKPSEHTRTHTGFCFGITELQVSVNVSSCFRLGWSGSLSLASGYCESFFARADGDENYIEQLFEAVSKTGQWLLVVTNITYFMSLQVHMYTMLYLLYLNF